MKRISSLPRDILRGCLIVGIAYFLLFQIMAKTHMIEKVMTLTCSWWELLLIAAFLVTRIFTYLFLGPILIAVAVYVAAQRLSKTVSPSQLL